MRTLYFVTVAFVAGMFFSMYCPLAKADDWYAEVGAGYGFNTPWGQMLDDKYYSWKGSNPIATIAVGREFGRSLSMEYFHASNWLTGFPFNDKHETSIDMVQVKYKWRF